MKPASRRFCRPGFTLIELLVVISIIALLVAILLPALGAASKAAQRSQSLSNCRQIATGTAAYAADDTEHRFPPMLRVSGTYSAYFSLLGKAGTSNPLAPRFRPLNEYLFGSADIPDDAEVDFARAPLDTGVGGELSNYDEYGSSYRANFMRQGDWIQGGGIVYGLIAGSNGIGGLSFTNDNGHIETPGVRLDVVRTPSEMVSVGETAAFTQGLSWGAPTRASDKFRWNFGPDGPDKWHLSFVDGHAALTEVKPGECWGDGFRFSWKDPPANYVQP